MLTLTDFLLIALFSLSTASWVCLLDYCYQTREIFSKWGLLLTWTWIMSARTQYGFGKETHYRPRKWWGYLTKPLGLCPFCSGVYWNTFFFALLVYFGIINAWIWPASVGLNYVFTKLIIKLE